MMALLVKSIALVLIVAFAFVVIPQQAAADECDDARLACALARIVAAGVCARRPAWCDSANQIADAICDWADGVCDDDD